MAMYCDFYQLCYVSLPEGSLGIEWNMVCDILPYSMGHTTNLVWSGRAWWSILRMENHGEILKGCTGASDVQQTQWALRFYPTCWPLSIQHLCDLKNSRNIWYNHETFMGISFVFHMHNNVEVLAKFPVLNVELLGREPEIQSAMNHIWDRHRTSTYKKNNWNHSSQQVLKAFRSQRWPGK